MPAAQSGPVCPDIALAAIIALPWLRGASPVAWAWQAKCAGPSAPTGPAEATSAMAPGLSSLCSGHGFGTDQCWRSAQTHPKKRHSGLWRQAERLRGQGATRRRGCGLSVERGAATTSRRQSFLPSGGFARQQPCPTGHCEHRDKPNNVPDPKRRVPPPQAVRAGYRAVCGRAIQTRERVLRP